MSNKKLKSQLIYKPKGKLRTASEVISRLRWPSDEDFANAQNTLLGYDCRINGPMEKCVQDHIGINEGGDIPEHRIQYFRLASSSLTLIESILWDRNGRVDRLFGSGLGGDAHVSHETVHNAASAIVNMKRLEEEKEIKAQEKARRNARQRAKQSTCLKELNDDPEPSNTKPCPLKSAKSRSNVLPADRHTWESLANVYVYCALTDRWHKKGMSEGCGDNSNLVPKFEGSIKVTTWNVLFDLHRDLENNDLILGDDTLFEGETCSEDRWKNLICCLERSESDIIALQEVTPRFLSLLQSQQWIQENYALSSISDDSKAIEPYGNLLLWRRDLFSMCCGLYLCTDGPRNRIVVASLLNRYDESVYLIANVHLPADQNASVKHSKQQKTIERSSARKRELTAAVGKLQILEQGVRRKKKQPIILILGDFNWGDDEVSTPLDNRLFSDLWQSSKEKTDTCGFTFNGEQNLRAAKTKTHGHSNKGPRRIDRIFLAKSFEGGSVDGTLPLEPLVAELLGQPDVEAPFPPSDHFGVGVSLQTRIGHKQLSATGLNNPCCIEQNAWARSSWPSAETILVLELNDCKIRNTNLYDSASSLPVPHITLLNGFVDLSSPEMRYLAAQAVEGAVLAAFHSNMGGLQSSLSHSIPFNRDSLALFEHRDSATLVCLPHRYNHNLEWLFRLYQTLRTVFPHCDEQESRFPDGWTPHVSIGSYGTVTAARNEIKKKESEGAWLQNEIQHVDVHAIGMYRRDRKDGNFYSVSSVPLARPNRNKEIQPIDTSRFIEEAGLSWMSSMRGTSSQILWEVDRACQYAARELSGGSMEAELRVYGSYALKASLPGISDLDAVVRLRPNPVHVGRTKGNAINSSSGEFFTEVISRLQSLHPASRCRMRIAGVGGVALHILTIKLSRGLPGLDLLACRMDKNDIPRDECSQIAMAAIDDFETVKRYVEEISAQQLGLKVSVNFLVAFQGALRIIKLWAVRRHIYGTNHGFLGGGGWAIVVARVICDGLNNQSLTIHNDMTDTSIMSNLLARFFWEHAWNYWSYPIVISLSPNEGNENDDHHTNRMNESRQSAIGDVLARGSMAVLAPISGGNFARSSTRSTSETTHAELKRAAVMLQASLDRKGIAISESNESTGTTTKACIDRRTRIRQTMVEICSPLSYDQLISPSSCVVAVEVSMKEDNASNGSYPRPVDIKAWCIKQTLSLIVEIEHRIVDASRIRSFSNPIRTKKSTIGSFCFLIRISDCTSQELRSLIDERSNLLEASCLPRTVAQIHCYSGDDARLEFNLVADSTRTSR